MSEAKQRRLPPLCHNNTGKRGQAEPQGKLPVEPAYGATVSVEPCSPDTPSPPAENSRKASPAAPPAPVRRIILASSYQIKPGPRTTQKPLNQVAVLGVSLLRTTLRTLLAVLLHVKQFILQCHFYVYQGFWLVFPLLGAFHYLLDFLYAYPALFFRR